MVIVAPGTPALVSASVILPVIRASAAPNALAVTAAMRSRHSASVFRMVLVSPVGFCLRFNGVACGAIPLLECGSLLPLWAEKAAASRRTPKALVKTQIRLILQASLE